MSIIQNLSKAGFNVHSYFETAREANKKYAMITRDAAIKEMKNLFGIHVDVESDRAASIALRYMIAESVRQYKKGFVVTDVDVKQIGAEKTETFFKNNPWINPSFKSELNDVLPEVNPQAKTKNKPKKGFKQEAAKRIYQENKGASNSVLIDLFMKQLNMSKAGASTYLYNIRKAAGEIPKGAKKGRKPKTK